MTSGIRVRRVDTGEVFETLREAAASSDEFSYDQLHRAMHQRNGKLKCGIQFEYVDEVPRLLQVEDLPGEKWYPIPGYEEIYSISNRHRIKSHKYNRIKKPTKPNSVGQASRISGVNPADISILLIWLAANKPKKRLDEDESDV